MSDSDTHKIHRTSEGCEFQVMLAHAKTVGCREFEEVAYRRYIAAWDAWKVAYLARRRAERDEELCQLQLEATR